MRSVSSSGCRVSRAILFLLFIPQLVFAESAAPASPINRPTLDEMIKGEKTVVGDMVLDLKGAAQSVARETVGAHPAIRLQSSNSERRIFIPLPIENSDLIATAVAGAAGFVVFKNDKSLMDLVQGNRGSTQDAVATFGKYWGWGIPNIVGSFGAYYLGGVYEDNQLKEFGILLMESLMASEAVSVTLKAAVGRERPNVSGDPYATGGFGSGLATNDYQSFPSGHSVAAMSLATLVSLEYGDQYKYLPVFAYLGAATTVYSRMYDQVHWASDLLVGGLIGHIVTKAVYSYRKHGNKNAGFQLFPMIDPVDQVYHLNVFWHPSAPDAPCDTRGLSPDEAVHRCMSEALERD